MGLFDWLIGGSESETKPKDLTPAPFKALQQPFADVLAEFMKTGGPGYEGPLAAPLSPEQQALVSQASGPSPEYMTSAGDELNRTLKGYYTPGGAGGGNPFLSAMIEAAQRPVRTAFEEDVIPKLISRFTGAGQEIQGSGSSAWATEGRKAGSDYLRTLADISTKLSGSAYESERQRQSEGVNQAGSLSTAQMSQMMDKLRAAALPQMVQDLGIERGLAEFGRKSEALLNVLRILAGVTAPTIANKQTSSSSTGLIPGLSPAAPTGTYTF